MFTVNVWKEGDKQCVLSIEVWTDFHHLLLIISNFFSGDLGQSICLIERDRNISCLGSGVSGLCIGLTPVPGPPHSDDE